MSKKQPPLIKLVIIDDMISLKVRYLFLLMCIKTRLKHLRHMVGIISLCILLPYVNHFLQNSIGSSAEIITSTSYLEKLREPFK